MIKVQKGLKRLVRSIIRIFLVKFLLILIALSIAIRYEVRMNNLAPWVAGELSSALHRQIMIEGASLSLWSGVVLKHVKISEHPTFKEGLFAQMETLTLKPQFFELLLGRVVVDDLGIYGAAINFSRNAQGAWNLAHIAHTEKDRPKVLKIGGVKTEEIDIPFNVSDLEIRASRFVVKDDLYKIPSMTIRDVSAQISDFSLGAPFLIDWGMIADIDAYSVALGTFPAWVDLLAQNPARMSIVGRFNFGHGDMSRAGAKFSEFEIKTTSWTIAAAGQLQTNAASKSNIEIHGQFRNFSGELSGKPIAMSGEAMSQFVVENGKTEREFSCQLKADNLNFSWGTLLQKNPGVPFDLSLKGVHVSTQPNHHNVQANLKLLVSRAPPSIVRGITFNLRRKPKEEKPTEDGEEFPQWQEPGQPTWQIAASSATLYPGALRGVFAPIRSWAPTSGAVNIDSIDAEGARGNWSVDLSNIKAKGASLDQPGDRVKNLEVGLEFLNLKGREGKWQAAARGAASVVGADTAFLDCDNLVAQLDLTGVGNTPEAKINGEIHLHLARGGIQNVPRLVAVAPFMKFLIQPLNIMEDLHRWRIVRLDGQDFTSIPMESMQGDYYFEYGRMNLEAVTIRGPLANVQVRGKVDFPANQINLMIVTSLPKEKIRWKVPDALLDDRGNPYLHIKVKGPLNSPEVYPVLGKKKDMLKELDENFRILRDKTKRVLNKIFSKI
ncbi:MAG: AsmA family protein [Elusimicrobia bacterium]|nr:AsmA family protein [Elusimicrobiota bacterium]